MRALHIRLRFSRSLSTCFITLALLYVTKYFRCSMMLYVTIDSTLLHLDYHAATYRFDTCYLVRLLSDIQYLVASPDLTSPAPPSLLIHPWIPDSDTTRLLSAFLPSRYTGLFSITTRRLAGESSEYCIQAVVAPLVTLLVGSDRPTFYCSV